MTFAQPPRNCSVSTKDVIAVLESSEPLTHTALASKLGIDWDELTPFIQTLKTDGRVTTRLDKRYELTTHHA